ncbi:hypothetical protein K438DRAFT_2050574 [Mycena galopus ATCC 62051]|nr:hypothetical protein K438DRAFT_2050574 [Mycena galopus ATCC 62051]
MWTRLQGPVPLAPRVRHIRHRHLPLPRHYQAPSRQKRPTRQHCGCGCLLKRPITRHPKLLSIPLLSFLTMVLTRLAEKNATASSSAKAGPGFSSLKEKPTPPLPSIYDKLVAEKGLEGVLHALRDTYGLEFLSTQQALMAARKSFSHANYDEVMDFFQLTRNKADPLKDWPDLETPQIRLPVSVMSDVADQVYQALATHGSPFEVNNAAFLSGPFLALTRLFGGVLRDRRPEQTISGSTMSGGGRAEIEIFCRDAVVFFLRDFNVRGNFSKSLARACCELYAIWHLNQCENKDASTHRPAFLIPVRTCLCDALNTYFIGYDGRVFSKYVIPRPAPASSLRDYVATAQEVSSYTSQVAQYSFGILVEGYNAVVKSYYARSLHRGRIGDRSAPSSYLPIRVPPPATTPSFDRASSTGWADAVKLGSKSAHFFARAFTKRSEHAADKGLQLLMESIRAWPGTSTASVAGTLESGITLLLPDTAERFIEQDTADYKATFEDDSDPEWEPTEEDADGFGFGYENARQQAVDAFWHNLGLEEELREPWEAKVQGNDDPFAVLRAFARNIEKPAFQNAVAQVMGPGFAAVFIGMLEQSEHEMMWSLQYPVDWLITKYSEIPDFFGRLA